MLVKVEIWGTGQNSCALADVDKLNDFKVVVDHALSAEAAGAAMATNGTGELLGGKAWVSITWLRSQLADQMASYWASFDEMVSYAESQGWLSSDQTALQAHVEHQDLKQTKE